MSLHDHVGRLGALADPGLDLVRLELDGGRLGQRVVEPEDLERASVA